jgi:hypothetical protein
MNTYSNRKLALGIRQMCNPSIEIGGVCVAKRIELLEQLQDIKHGHSSWL